MIDLSFPPRHAPIRVGGYTIAIETCSAHSVESKHGPGMTCSNSKKTSFVFSRIVLSPIKFLDVRLIYFPVSVLVSVCWLTVAGFIISYSERMIVSLL